ncbi:hypothetical protein EVAR_98264_1 [Eumeta japonica]|uniref:Uncharacterized protein n=1 Tax=Eumeta variegata TaxID=151549 RepID=A0A4C2A178_EUMVA|nr:hypothetical protein EVAR_98264_1 [Eumeta japonica]
MSSQEHMPSKLPEIGEGRLDTDSEDQKVAFSMTINKSQGQTQGQHTFGHAMFSHGTGRRTYILPHAWASSRRGHDPDTVVSNGPLLDPLFDILPEPVADPHAGARSLRRRRRGGPGVGRCSTRVGRRPAGHAADRRWSDAGGRRPDQAHASVTRVGGGLSAPADR